MKKLGIGPLSLIIYNFYAIFIIIYIVAYSVVNFRKWGDLDSNHLHLPGNETLSFRQRLDNTLSRQRPAPWRPGGLLRH